MREVTGSKAYTFGYSPAAISIMSGRSAQENAGFFLPYLSPGMRVLDCGCGQGAITVGIGSAVAPGKVIGLDIEPSQIDLGRSEAAQQGGANVQFEVGDVEDLQFPDDSFDAVFGHTILMQFQDPTPMLREVFRVVKKGGVVGFREIDIGGSLYAPTGSALELLMKTFEPPRDCRRLKLLRGLSDDKQNNEQVFR